MRKGRTIRQQKNEHVKKWQTYAAQARREGQSGMKILRVREPSAQQKTKRPA
jgi:hypothetical protein